MEFQAHERQIDTLSSQLIPDMVSQILWLNQPTQNSLLTANSKEIRLWKIKQKYPKHVEQAKRNFKRGFGLVIPKFQSAGEPV